MAASSTRWITVTFLFLAISVRSFAPPADGVAPQSEELTPEERIVTDLEERRRKIEAEKAQYPASDPKAPYRASLLQILKNRYPVANLDASRQDPEYSAYLRFAQSHLTQFLSSDPDTGDLFAFYEKGWDIPGAAPRVLERILNSPKTSAQDFETAFVGYMSLKARGDRPKAFAKMVELYAERYSMGNPTGQRVNQSLLSLVAAKQSAFLVRASDPAAARLAFAHDMMAYTAAHGEPAEAAAVLASAMNRTYPENVQHAAETYLADLVRRRPEAVEGLKHRPELKAWAEEEVARQKANEIRLLTDSRQEQHEDFKAEGERIDAAMRSLRDQYRADDATARAAAENTVTAKCAAWLSKVFHW